jgi:arylsulfatase A-like enzyme
MIANLDYNIDRVLKTLDACGIRENTLVILMNDNGGTIGVDTYNCGMRGTKAGVYRGSTRAFSFWHWPNTLKPAVRNEMTAHLDVLPTLCEIAGVQVDEQRAALMEGKSLLPLLTGRATDSTPWNNRILVTHRGRWNINTREDAENHRNSFVSLRWQKYAFVSVQPCTNPTCLNDPECRVVKDPSKRYAYTQNPGFHFAATDGWKLFDLENDPDQSNDISAEYPEIVERLTEYYNNWWDEAMPGIYPSSTDK